MPGYRGRRLSTDQSRLRVTPYAELMRKYCLDYTSCHDISWIEQLMSPAYRIHISGRTLGIDEYRTAVVASFARYPTLGLTVHEMIMSDDRLALRFSEHGALSGEPGSVAVWAGISLYQWDGTRLLSCRVEQDFEGRDQQGAQVFTARLEPAHPDPWATTEDQERDPATERLAADWINRWAIDPDGNDGPITLLEINPSGRLIDTDSVEIDDVFSAGDRVAAAVTLRGRYRGGLSVDSSRLGAQCELAATLLARVEDDRVTDVLMVRDRWGLTRRLRNPAPGR